MREPVYIYMRFTGTINGDYFRFDLCIIETLCFVPNSTFVIGWQNYSNVFTLKLISDIPVFKIVVVN